jgi:hypothetical protein
MSQASRLGSALALSLALLSWPTAGRAADVPVSYSVDAKELKQAVAGTALTFELFSDAACSSSVHQAQVLAEQVSQVVELKLARRKGAPKPPKTAELRHVLSGVALAGSLYLKVTGTGVVPVGADCQVQTAAPGGRFEPTDLSFSLIVPGNGTNAEWVSIYADATVRSASPALVGTTVSRPASGPVGIYCLVFPGGAPVTGEAATGSIQHNQGGTQVSTILVTTFYGHTCNDVPGWDVAVDTLGWVEQ